MEGYGEVRNRGIGGWNGEIWNREVRNEKS